MVDHAKIDWRNKALTLIELKKRLKEKYMQLRNENGWAEDEMALAASQNSTKNQNKGSNQRKTKRFKGRGCHCAKYGHKKVDCRDWLKSTKEEQEKSEEKARKNKDHIKYFNCNRMGHYTSECPEKKPKDSSGGSSGGFAMMCFEVNHSPVEGDSDQTSAHHTEQPHSEEKFGSSFRSSFGSSFRRKV